MKTLWIKSLLLLSIAILINACVPGVPPGGVQAPSGRYVGVDDLTFLGIPYARPPIGELRWRKPESLPSTGSTGYLATYKRAGCTQGIGFTGVFYESEDCLYLNIWRPVDRSTPVPVMVYIHGGSGDIGSGGEVQYEGKFLKDLGVMVVTVNARLGIMGFLSLQDFTDEGFVDDGVSHSGNYNYLDQLKALEWVHDNIAAFGGDPNNVTLFGESAGAMATCAHLASPMSNTSGYFHKAIIQSGSCEFTTRSQATADGQGQTLAQNVMGCFPQLFVGDGTTASCLRSMSVEQIYGLAEAANPGANALSFTPILPLTAIDDNFFIDGGVSGTVKESLLTHGNPAIPVIIGHNLNEGTLLHAFSVPTVQTAAQYSDYLTTAYSPPAVNADVAALNLLYPVGNYRKPINALSELDGDKIFVCPARRTADALQESGHSVYYYELQQPVKAWLRNFVEIFNLGFGPDLGVFHSSDIPLVFGTNSVLGDARKPASKPTMFMMMEYWTNFAKTGVPTSATAQNLGVAAWPLYVSPATPGGTRDYMILKSASPGTGSQLKQTQCDYWETHIDPVFFD